MKAALPLILILALHALAQAPSPPIHDEPLTPPTIVYPAAAKQKHIQGTVELEVHVSDTGRVTDVRALSGPEELRQAAVDAYALATYRPLLRAGKPIPAIVATHVDFSLHEAPSSPDDLVARDFEPLHTQCETLGRAKDPDALATCQQALTLAARFSPTGHMVAHAVAYNDLAQVLLALGRTREATALGEEAVTKVADAYPSSLAAANAYLTRAETRARSIPTPDLKGGVADCAEAERILHGLLDQRQAPYLAEDMKAQLKGVLRLHAVLLRRRYDTRKAKALEDEADKL